MEHQFRHSLLVDEDHDEEAREYFAMDLAGYLAREVQPGTRKLFDTRVDPAFRRQHQRAPNRTETRKALLRQPYYQMWSSLKRTDQEILFDAVGEAVEHQLGGMIARSKKPARKTGGSLKLDPKVKAPRYLTAVDIHCMPGNYTGDLGDNDVSAGAIFDRGLFLYGRGGLGPQSDDMGASVCAWLKKAHPGFAPKTILEMGCSIGGNLLPYARQYPKAKVHAIDVGTSILRYGHARAEELGVPVHFSQQNAEHTNFADGSFDLIVSHLLTHETSLSGYRNIMRECFRLLRPGGMMLHTETEWSTETDPYNQSILDWETHYNAEPFKTKLDTLAFPAEAAKAGFTKSKAFVAKTPSLRATVKYYQGRWVVSGATK
jgi:2-polyprenyl-3-methyl-5-hydroxy-6-metoxy-1,4-benzoquinol methylase